MNLLVELNSVFEALDISVETGIFSNEPPDEYIVITPMSDKLNMFADNKAHMVISQARISLFSKKNYIKRKQELIRVLLDGKMTITDCQYVGFEQDTKYHHYAIDVMREYETEVD